MGCGSMRAVENEIVDNLESLQNKMNEMEKHQKIFVILRSKNKHSPELKKFEKKIMRLNLEIMDFFDEMSDKLLICEEQTRKNNHPKLTSLKRKYYELYRKYR